DRARVGPHERRRDREHARLPRARRPDDRSDRAVRHRERDIVERRDALRAIGVGESDVVEDEAHRALPKAVRGSTDVTRRTARPAPARPRTTSATKGTRMVDGLSMNGTTLPITAPRPTTRSMPTPVPASRRTSA